MSVTRNLTPSPLGAPRREDGVTPAGRVVDLAFPVRRDVDAARPAARDATGRRGLVFFRHPRPRPRSRRHAGRGQVRRRDEHTQVPPPPAACMCAAWVPARPHSSPRCGVGAPLPSRGALCPRSRPDCVRRAPARIAPRAAGASRPRGRSWPRSARGC